MRSGRHARRRNGACITAQSFFGTCRMGCVSQSVATSTSIVQGEVFRAETFATYGSAMRDSFNGRGLCATSGGIRQDVIVGVNMGGRVSQSIPAPVLVVPADTPPTRGRPLHVGARSELHDGLRTPLQAAEQHEHRHEARRHGARVHRPDQREPDCST
ncbi:unnamed protein product [Prorocentrum cordatum]|uniref:Uncharacterized protein n=1 Tax=Prorocentrum cordatum TaxID=2364126 RepID=A0ABN9TRG8_9DINO|nr:unnamed protein product [Polarella glacialis]